MIYSDFIECENATIVIKSDGVATIDPVTYETIYTPVEVFNDSGIFYELAASEIVARQQIQKGATGQVILDPNKITTPITNKMELFVTTTDKTNKKYRIVTDNNPLNLNEAIIIDIVED